MVTASAMVGIDVNFLSLPVAITASGETFPVAMRSFNHARSMIVEHASTYTAPTFNRPLLQLSIQESMNRPYNATHPV